MDKRTFLYFYAKDLKFISWLFAVCLFKLCLNITQIVHAQTMTQQQRESLIEYCFQHADRPNPIDDLIDKGFLSSSFRGETCLSVNEAHENEQIRIKEESRILQETINKENQANIDRYQACMQNSTNEYCENILENNDGPDPYNACLMNRSTTWEECQNILMGNMSGK
jgi:hypothetical protein